MVARNMQVMVVAVMVGVLMGGSVAQAAEPRALRAVSRVPVLHSMLYATLGLCGAYENKDDYVSYREANAATDQVGPATDTDSALYAGD